MKLSNKNTPVEQHPTIQIKRNSNDLLSTERLNAKAANDKRTLISFGSIAALIGCFFGNWCNVDDSDANDANQCSKMV